MKSYILLLLFFISFSFRAQQIISKVDSATGGKLIISADEEIIKMINQEEICKKFSDGTQDSKSSLTPNERKPVNKPLTPENNCGRRNDIPGFMIKVGEAKSEQEVNTMMSEFRRLFPELRVEKSYLRPDWRLLAGDYFIRESAKSDLKRIKKNFPNALLVNWRIYCNRAK
ncbi:SPOR domain-containing protein [Apibacter sp.]|uniref:SPOR domain-containing protein n=1 Tax=Apibacter sp. TaxID=2023709 RepID=UPI0025DEF174|nr:SPOR domain-containing protein [Apibacter sp.]MCT6869465.1 SPOR domain-containing protein [Apibacter sp.]